MSKRTHDGQKKTDNDNFKVPNKEMILTRGRTVRLTRQLRAKRQPSPAKQTPKSPKPVAKSPPKPAKPVEKPGHNAKKVKKVVLKPPQKLRKIEESRSSKRKPACPKKNTCGSSPKRTADKRKDVEAIKSVPSPKSLRQRCLEDSAGRSFLEVVRVREREELTNEDLLEIVQCPSPVWWEDPPDERYDEDPIFVQATAAEEKPQNQREELTLPPLPDSKREPKFMNKMSMLENVLQNLKAKGSNTSYTEKRAKVMVSAESNKTGTVDKSHDSVDRPAIQNNNLLNIEKRLIVQTELNNDKQNPGPSRSSDNNDIVIKKKIKEIRANIVDADMKDLLNKMHAHLPKIKCVTAQTMRLKQSNPNSQGKKIHSGSDSAELVCTKLPVIDLSNEQEPATNSHILKQNDENPKQSVSNSVFKINLTNEDEVVRDLENLKIPVSIDSQECIIIDDDILESKKTDSFLGEHEPFGAQMTSEKDNLTSQETISLNSQSDEAQMVNEVDLEPEKIKWTEMENEQEIIVFEADSDVVYEEEISTIEQNEEDVPSENSQNGDTSQRLSGIESLKSKPIIEKNQNDMEQNFREPKVSYKTETVKEGSNKITVACTTGRDNKVDFDQKIILHQDRIKTCLENDSSKEHHFFLGKRKCEDDVRNEKVKFIIKDARIKHKLDSANMFRNVNKSEYFKKPNLTMLPSSCEEMDKSTVFKNKNKSEHSQKHNLTNNPCLLKSEEKTKIVRVKKLQNMLSKPSELESQSSDTALRPISKIRLAYQELIAKIRKSNPAKLNKLQNENPNLDACPTLVSKNYNEDKCNQDDTKIETKNAANSIYGDTLKRCANANQVLDQSKTHCNETPGKEKVECEAISNECKIMDEEKLSQDEKTNIVPNSDYEIRTKSCKGKQVLEHRTGHQISKEERAECEIQSDECQSLKSATTVYDNESNDTDREECEDINHVTMTKEMIDNIIGIHNTSDNSHPEALEQIIICDVNQSLPKKDLVIAHKENLKYCFKCSSIYDTIQCSYCTEPKEQIMKKKSNSKVLSCDLCQFRSKKQCYMEVHALTHANEKPYSCDDCKSTFKTKASLTSHLQRHCGEDLEHRQNYCDENKVTDTFDSFKLEDTPTAEQNLENDGDYIVILTER